MLVQRLRALCAPWYVRDRDVVWQDEHGVVGIWVIRSRGVRAVQDGEARCGGVGHHARRVCACTGRVTAGFPFLLGRRLRSVGFGALGLGGLEGGEVVCEGGGVARDVVLPVSFAC